jgi:rhamnose transport system permease protein
VVSINVVLSPFFLVPFNLSNVATAAVEIGLLALPATLLIIAGEIDLSIASTLALSAAVLAIVVQSGAPWYLAVGAALLTGATAGLVNGLLVTQLGLSSIIVTIGTLALFRGLAEVILGDQTIQGIPGEIAGWNLQYIGDSLVTWPHLFLVVAAIVFAVFLNRTRGGRTIKLIGSAPDVARYSGVSVARTKIMLFVLSGFVSAVAAVFLVSRLQAVRNDIGLGMELVAITVVLIGGTDLRGGRGTVWGTVIALAVVGAVRSGLRLANVPDQVGLAVVGGLLIIAILVARFRDRFESSLERRHATRLAEGELIDEREHVDEHERGSG